MIDEQYWNIEDKDVQEGRIFGCIYIPEVKIVLKAAYWMSNGADTPSPNWLAGIRILIHEGNSHILIFPVFLHG